MIVQARMEYVLRKTGFMILFSDRKIQIIVRHYMTDRNFFPKSITYFNLCIDHYEFFAGWINSLLIELLGMPHLFDVVYFIESGSG